MSLERPRGRPLALLVYGLLVLAGMAIAYLELRDIFTVAGDVALSLGYLLVIGLMVRHWPFLSRLHRDQPRFTIRIKIPDLVKSLICFVAALLWGGIAASMMGDTPAGNAVVVVPALGILGIGAFFIARSFTSRIR
jgi:hypothetical protein